VLKTSVKVFWVIIFSLGFQTIPSHCIAQEESPKDAPIKDAVDRLTRKNLQAIRDTIEKYAQERQAISPSGPYRTVRAK